MSDVKKENAKSFVEEEGNTSIITFEERGNQNIVRRSNQLVQLTRNNLTLQQQRLMLHIFAMIKPEDTELPTYEMSIFDFLKLSGFNPNSGSMYRLVKKNIEELANAPVQWINQPGTESMETFRWIDKVKINKATGRMVLVLDKALKPYLIQLKSLYTTLDIRYTTLMRSTYSVRIYELCKSQQNLYLRYKEQGKPLVWKLETLYEQLSYQNHKWSEFRRNCLEMAKREINGNTDIIFDYEPYSKVGKKMASITVTIESISEADAKKNLLQIDNTVEKRMKRKLKADTADGDDEGTVITLDYVSAPNTSIPYYYGKDKTALRHEFDIKARMDTLQEELSPEELNAVNVVLDLIAAACCTGKADEEMKDGGNVKMFNAVNTIILETDGLDSWLRGIAPRYAGHVIPDSLNKKSPVPYLTKVVKEDMENYRIYAFKKKTTQVKAPNIVFDDSNTDTTEPKEEPKVVLEDDASSEPVITKTELLPEDAYTKKSMEKAIRDCIDEESILPELTTQGQREAYNDIIKNIAYFCRRNRVGKDEGSMQGKANMGFLKPLNSVIKKYGNLNPFVLALAKKLDYDTFWDETAKNPKIKNPQAYLKYLIEQAISFPEICIREYKSKTKEETETPRQKDMFNQDWDAIFEDNF